MQLWEKGTLDLDQDVRKLVPEFPAKGETITQDVSTLENPAILDQLKESA